MKTFEIFPTLAVSGNPTSAGSESWAISIGITGGTIQAIDLQGITVSTIFDDDGDPTTPPLSPYLLDLSEAPVRDAELATRADDPGRSGAISMVNLAVGNMALQPNGAQRIARLLVQVTIPKTYEPRDVVLRFEDGFRSTGLPRENRVNLDDIYELPVLGVCRFRIQNVTGKRVPGDTNRSGILEISDAVVLFGNLFLGSQVCFICGDGYPSDPGNMALLDWQLDGTLDISDGIAILQFLFLGGQRHHLASPGNELRGCAPMPGCPDSEFRPCP